VKEQGCSALPYPDFLFLCYSDPNDRRFDRVARGPLREHALGHLVTDAAVVAASASLGDLVGPERRIFRFEGADAVAAIGGRVAPILRRAHVARGEAGHPLGGEVVHRAVEGALRDAGSRGPYGCGLAEFAAPGSPCYPSRMM